MQVYMPNGPQGELMEDHQACLDVKTEISSHDGGIPIFRIRDRTPEETEIAQDLLQLSRSLPPLRPKAIPVPVVVTHSASLLSSCQPTPPDTPNAILNHQNGLSTMHINNLNGHSILSNGPTNPNTILKFSPNPISPGTYSTIGLDVTITNLDSGGSGSQLTQLVPSQPFHLQTVSLSPPPESHHNSHHHHHNGQVTFQHPSHHVVPNTNVIMHHGSGTNTLVIRNNDNSSIPLTPSTSEYSSDAENVCPSKFSSSSNSSSF